MERQYKICDSYTVHINPEVTRENESVTKKLSKEYKTCVPTHAIPVRTNERFPVNTLVKSRKKGVGRVIKEHADGSFEVKFEDEVILFFSKGCGPDALVLAEKTC